MQTTLPNRACPTTGSDRGSLRDPDLTLIVGPQTYIYHLRVRQYPGRRL
jgi:hypothetical protein